MALKYQGRYSLSWEALNCTSIKYTLPRVIEDLLFTTIRSCEFALRSVRLDWEFEIITHSRREAQQVRLDDFKLLLELPEYSPARGGQLRQVYKGVLTLKALNKLNTLVVTELNLILTITELP